MSRCVVQIMLICWLTLAGGPVEAQDPGTSGVDGLEALMPGLEEACELALARLLDQDPALMDAPADPRVLLIKERAKSPTDAEELDRAVRLLNNFLFQRNFRVTVVEFPAGASRALVKVGFPRESAWEVGVDSVEDRKVVRMRVEGPTAISVAVPYVHKPWVSDFAGWAADRKGVLYFCGRSGLEADPERARDEALSAAVAQLREALLEASDRPPLGIERAGKKLRTCLENELGEPIIANKYLEDWYLGESRKAYGRLFRGYALLGVPESDYRLLRARVSSAISSWKSGLLLMLGSLALIVPLVFVTYMKVDQATRGYFTWWLRLGALGGVAAAGVAAYLHFF